MGDWLKDLKASGDANICVLLVGNKADLAGRKVAKEQANAYAEKHKFSYLETSCLDGSNVEAVFQSISNDILECLRTSLCDASG